MSVVTRIAPSPTGKLHIGTARSALFNYLYARQHNGRFLVRIEDTDRERSKAEYEEDIRENLAWLGLSHDELYKQSERNGRHQALLSELISAEKAYVSKEPSKADPAQTVEVVRLKNPGKHVTFADSVRGEVTFDTTELGDFVIARNIYEPLYHFAVVVDDHDSGITHVIRGEDHISNTPRQILILEALGWERPQYGHIPLILASDRSKMSKRKGSVSISEYREKGYLPEAIINYLALLGWNPGTDQEFFTLDELVQAFDIEKVQKGGAIFDIKKLNWFNAHYVRNLPQEELLHYVGTRIEPTLKEKPQWGSERLLKALPALTERMENATELTELAEKGDLDFYFDTPKYATELLIPKKGNEEGSAIQIHLEKLVSLLDPLHEDSFTKDSVKEAVFGYAEEEGRGAVLWPMRVALSGREHSPDPFTLAEIFGKAETLERLRAAITKLSHAS